MCGISMRVLPCSGVCALDRIRHPFTAHTKRDVLYTLLE